MSEAPGPGNFGLVAANEYDEVIDLGIPLGLRLRPQAQGISAAGWSDRTVEYETWDCDCKKGGDGLPVRHFLTPTGVAIASVEVKAPEARHGSIKRDADGWQIIDDKPERTVTFEPCPTWRYTTRWSTPRRRDWSYEGVVESKPEPAEPEPVQPAGRTTEPAWVEPESLGRSARILAKYAQLPILRVTGRRVAGGPIVVQDRVRATDGSWGAVFTNDHYDHGWCDGRRIDYRTLVRYVKSRRSD